MKLLSSIFALSLACAAYCQNYELDLSKKDHRNIPVEPGTPIKISILNRLYQKDYTISVIRKIVPIEVIDIPAQISPSLVSPALDSAMAINPCDDLLLATQALENESDEANIPGRISDLRKIIDLHQKARECSGDIARANTVIAMTESLGWTGTLNLGEELEFQVQRDDNGTLRTWIYTFKTPPVGKWDMSFAFTITAQSITREDIYYSQSTDQGFSISKEHNRRSFAYAPALMFTFYPYGKQNNRWNFGLSPGVGTDFTEPMLFLCGTATHWHAVRFHLGLSFMPIYVLKGQYTPGQLISENLSRDQLHDKLLKPNLFFAVSLKLKENIFR